MHTNFLAKPKRKANKFLYESIDFSNASFSTKQNTPMTMTFTDRAKQMKSAKVRAQINNTTNQSANFSPVASPRVMSPKVSRTAKYSRLSNSMHQWQKEKKEKDIMNSQFHERFFDNDQVFESDMLNNTGERMIEFSPRERNIFSTIDNR